MKYYPRQIEKTIKKYIKIFPAIAIIGPRQSGKSTTLKEIFGKQYKYVSFDDPLTVDFFNQDPIGFMNKYSNKVIFDEVQKVPAVFNYLKIKIDEDRHNYGKFILTGSSQFSLIKTITETLAGRIGVLSLLPFQMDELPEQYRHLQILKGSYPELMHLGYKNTKEWYGSYIANYIERDVRNFSNIGNLNDFQRFIRLLAARVAQELNISSLSKEMGITVKTLQNWISILEASYIIFLLPSYHKNLGKRIVKRPKLYFYDTGLICYFTAITKEEVLRNGPLDGAIFENFIVAELKKIIVHTGQLSQMYYFRSNLGLEVDLILENLEENKIKLLEIKSTETVRIEMFKNLLKVSDLIKSKNINNYLIFRGKTEINYKENCNCLNFNQIGQLLQLMRQPAA